MDFDDTAEEAAFRAEVHAWLAANARSARTERGYEGRVGPSTVDAMGEARAWQAKKAAKGDTDKEGSAEAKKKFFEVCLEHQYDGKVRHCEEDEQ